MRVLVVEDEVDLRNVLARALRADGHAIAIAGDLREARERISEGTDLLVLDLRLPDGFGLELCRELRAEGSTMPILLLTALSQVELRVEGLDSGADDFLAKPFAIAELRARVRALGRRGALPRGLVYRYGSFVLDFAGRHAMRDGQMVAVTAKEWSILEMLARRPGRVISRLDLLDGVWGDASETASSSLEVLVGRLRRKFDANMIRTLRGEGYSLAVGPADGE